MQKRIGHVCTADVGPGTGSLNLTRQYYLNEHLGNIGKSINETGMVVGYDDYYPFGQQMDGRCGVMSSTSGMFKYTGKERDAETNYDDFGARLYARPPGRNARIARWLQVDPLDQKYPGWSTYNYCLNNPMLFIDPDGRAVDWFKDGDGNYQFHPSIKSQEDLNSIGSGNCTYIGPTIKTSLASFRSDGSVMFHNAMDAVNFLASESFAYFNVDIYGGIELAKGTERFMVALNDGRGLVLPWYNMGFMGGNPFEGNNYSLNGHTLRNTETGESLKAAFHGHSHPAETTPSKEDQKFAGYHGMAGFTVNRNFIQGYSANSLSKTLPISSVKNLHTLYRSNK